MEKLDYIHQMNMRTEALLRQIIEGKLEARNEVIEKIDHHFAEVYKSQNFNGSSARNVFIDIDNSFEDVCFILENNGVHRPKEIPIYEFQRKLVLIKKRSKPRKSHVNSTDT